MVAIYRFLAVLGCAVVLALTAAASAHAEKRVALVIGNSAYVHVPQLANPVNDARLMAETLRALGFALVGDGPQLDLNEIALRRVVREFSTKLQGADVGLFYYAGHAVEVRGSNYLVPVGANPAREADVDFQMLNTNLVLRQMESAGTKLNLVILDACRNNPFAGRGLRSAGSGLARMQTPEGTLISFATQPGNVALDGDDGNSPYTKALAQTMRKPGLGLFDVFNEVGLSVKRATAGNQQPWVSSSPISGGFYFAQRAIAVEPKSDKPTAAPPSDAARAWESVKDTKDKTLLQAFLDAFPDGFYAALARARLKQLSETNVAVGTFPAKARTFKPDTISVSPRVIPVGKWPEGIGWSGRDLWVAESGDRQIAQIDVEAGRVVRRVKVGRLPVGIFSSSGERIYVVVVTDKKIWEQKTGGRGHVFGQISDSPEAVTGDASTLYVLSWMGNNYAPSRVTRYDLSTGRRLESGTLIRAGQDIAIGGGNLWTVHVSNQNRSELLRLDLSSLQLNGQTSADGTLRKLVASDQAVFAGGYTQDGKGLVVTFDPQTGREVGRTVLDGEAVRGLILYDDYVVAIDRRGVISVLLANDLALRRTIRMDFNFGSNYPQTMALYGQSLAITTHRGIGQNGSLLIIPAWRP